MIVRAIVEIPQGSQNKYEYDVKTGRLRLDRVLYPSMHYPVNYGFLPDTWGEDNDPLDVLIFGSFGIHPGVEVAVRVVGALVMQDEHGPDAKLVGVLDADPRYAQVKALHDLESHRLREIRHFFAEYKRLQGLPVTVGDYQDLAAATQLIVEGRERYQRIQGARVS
jgi:inorganic pyrophosphatase